MRRGDSFPGAAGELDGHGSRRYQTTNSRGALVSESLAVLEALATGRSVQVVRERALAGQIFRHRARLTRRHCWKAIHARYLASGASWILDDLMQVARRGPHDPSVLGLLYLHFVLRDPLTLDWVTGPLWERWRAGHSRLTRNDVHADIGRLVGDMDVRWSESSRLRLASGLLSALRDFGLAKGVRVKTLTRPVLTPEVVSHLLRLLVERGTRGAAVVEHPAWRSFLRGPEDVIAELARLAQHQVIRFERSGTTVVLETPWSAA